MKMQINLGSLILLIMMENRNSDRNFKNGFCVISWIYTLYAHISQTFCIQRPDYYGKCRFTIL